MVADFLQEEGLAGVSGVAVNPVTNTIYVANADSDTVSVIDGTKNTVVRDLPVGDHPTDVTVNPEINTIYVTNGEDDNLSAINLNSK